MDSKIPRSIYFLQLILVRTLSSRCYITFILQVRKLGMGEAKQYDLNVSGLILSQFSELLVCTLTLKQLCFSLVFWIFMVRVCCNQGQCWYLAMSLHHGLVHDKPACFSVEPEVYLNFYG